MPPKQWRGLPTPIRGLTVLAGLSIILLGSNTLLGSNSRMAATSIMQADIPLIIDQPGRYVVTENLSALAGLTAISIQTDHVQLSLNGFTLSGPVSAADDCINGGVGFGIEVAGTPEDPVVGVHITDGTVRGFPTGILLSNASANRLDALTVTATCSCGIRLLDANHNRVNQNSASTNFGTGVCVVNSNKNRFHRNTVNDNAVLIAEEISNVGYLLSSSHGNVISANDVSGNGVDTAVHGIVLIGSNNNTIRGSRLQRNAGSGIRLFSSSNNTIRANFASANDVGGIGLFTFTTGNFIEVSTGNLIQGNEANGALIGIQVDSISTANTIRRNTALDNITDLADFSFGPCPNVWKNNTFVTKDGNVSCIE